VKWSEGLSNRVSMKWSEAFHVLPTIWYDIFVNCNWVDIQWQ